MRTVTRWAPVRLFCVAALLGIAVNAAPTVAIAQDDPAEVNDMPGIGIWGPAYRLRNVPADMQLKVRMSPDRAAQTAGLVRSTTSEILILDCTPRPDTLTYEDASLGEKHTLLTSSWCLISVPGGLEGYVPGVYLDPILGR